MSITLGRLLVHATIKEQFIDQNYAIYQSGTLLTITDLESNKCVYSFLYQFDQYVQGFTRVHEQQPFDPFLLVEPLQTHHLEFDQYSISLRFYPFDYCEMRDEYPIELAIFIPELDRKVSIEVSLDGKIKLFHHEQTSHNGQRQ